MTHIVLTDPKIWDDFIKNSQMATIFHNWAILKVIEKHSKYQLIPIGIYKKEELICVIPLFINNKNFIKMLFSPPPSSGIPYLGPILKDEYRTAKQGKKESYLRIVADELSLIFKKINPSYFSVTLVPEIQDIRYFKWRGFNIVPNFTYLMATNIDLELIWLNIDKDTRKQIKKAESLKITVKDTSDVDQIYESLKNRYNEQKINFPLYGIDYLKELKKIKPANFLFKVAEYNENIVASRITLCFNDTLIFWMGNAKSRDHVYGNEFLTWETIRLSKQLNLKNIDLNGADNESISNFKSKFNPILSTYYVITRNNLIGKTAEFVYKNLIKRKIF
jgi:hypothetical protein